METTQPHKVTNRAEYKTYGFYGPMAYLRNTTKLAVINFKLNGKKYILTRVDNLKKGNVILFKDMEFAKITDIKKMEAKKEDEEESAIRYIIFYKTLNYEDLLKLMRE